MESESVRVGEEILSQLDAFFAGMKDQYEPHECLLANIILRAARDWFRGRDEDPESEDAKARERYEYACGAYQWFMSDSEFIGVLQLPLKPTGVVSFRVACSCWGLSPERFRSILHIVTLDELEFYLGRKCRSS